MKKQGKYFQLINYLCIIITPFLYVHARQKNTLEVRPFSAYRPASNLIKQIVSFPYNITTLQEARAHAHGNRFSFLHISHPEVDLPDTVQYNHSLRGEQSKSMLYKFINKEWLKRDKGPAFYVYALQKKQSRHIGIIAEVAIKNYDQGLIKRHECIIPQKKNDLVEFTDSLNASIDPSLLIYSPSQKIDALVHAVIQEQPKQSFIDEEGTVHRLWLIQDKNSIALLQKYFSEVPVLYIADGHHRTAATHFLQKIHQNRKEEIGNFSGKEPSNYLLAALFPANQIEIYSYNRIVKNVGNLTKQEFFETLKTKFKIKKVANHLQANPSVPHCFGMYFKRTWYLLTLKKEFLQKYQSSPIKNLALNILSDTILHPIFNLHNKRADNLAYIGGENSLEKLEQACKDGVGQLAFALCPVSSNDFMKIISLDKLMPPKTTWFEPKIRLGLFVRSLE